MDETAVKLMLVDMLNVNLKPEAKTALIESFIADVTTENFAFQSNYTSLLATCAALATVPNFNNVMLYARRCILTIQNNLQAVY